MAAKEYEFHEAANLFPLDDEHMDSLAEDIKANGLQCPVELMDGKILDGRRRHMACRLANVEPDFVDVNPDDPVSYVLSLNLHRRHLDVSQMSMCAARADKLWNKLKEDAKERQKRKPVHSVPDTRPEQNQSETRDTLGEKFGVSGKSVDRARHIVRDGIPEIADAVDDGTLTVTQGQRIAAEPKEKQPAMLAEEIKPRKERTKDDSSNGKSLGVGIQHGRAAVDCLKKIPKNDGLRKRGFQVVSDWIRKNK